MLLSCLAIWLGVRFGVRSDCLCSSICNFCSAVIQFIHTFVRFFNFVIYNRCSILVAAERCSRNIPDFLVGLSSPFPFYIYITGSQMTMSNFKLSSVGKKVYVVPPDSNAVYQPSLTCRTIR